MNSAELHHRSVASPIRVRRIVLTGFMGSGKTTVGPLVATQLGWRFIDVDDVIEAEAGMTIAEIFARHGEAAFRRPRSTRPSPACCREMTWCWPSAAGPSSPTPRAACCSLRPATLLIHLEVELATTLARCRGTEDIRPVLADQANLAARYERRLPLYRTAHVSIAADLLLARKVADAISEPRASDRIAASTRLLSSK